MAERTNNWATPSMREYAFWRDGMQPEEFEKEYDYYHQCLYEGKMIGYIPLWKQNKK